ncbi:MAG: hypothetical protein AAF604_08095 [Acidobacteriota bacterium]
MTRQLLLLETLSGHGTFAVGEAQIPVRYEFRIQQWFVEGAPGVGEIEGSMTVLNPQPSAALIAAFADDSNSFPLTLEDGTVVQVEVFKLDNPAAPSWAQLEIGSGERYFDQRLKQ